jgi:hypothetical protein
MTPVELLQFTYVRFKLSILSLMLMISLFLLYNVFHHTVSLVALVYALVYIIVLNVGMRGASTRSVAMLRFYWVFQLVQLIVFLLTAVALVGFFAYVHVVDYQMHKQQPQMDKTINALEQHADPVGGQTIHKDVHDIATANVVHQTATKTLDAPAKPQCSITNVLMVLLPSLVSLIVIFTVTRSIVLARQLITLLLTHAELADVELNACCQKDSWCQKDSCCQKESCSETPLTPVVSQEMSTPITVYVAPEGFVHENAVYPGQLMPVYVDKFGQPIH